MEIRVTSQDIVSVAQAAEDLGRPRITIYRWIQAGKIIGIRLGGILFIPKSEIGRLKSEENKEATD